MILGVGGQASYPGAKLAYDTVKPSYDLAIARIEAANRALEGLFAFALALASAVVSLGLSNKIADFRSLWLLAAGTALVIALGWAWHARSSGEITVISPTVLFNDWLELTEDDYKRYAVMYAGEHFESNRQLVYRKWKTTQRIAIVVAAEAVLLLVWLALAPPNGTHGSSSVAISGSIPFELNVSGPDGVPVAVKGTLTASGTGQLVEATPPPSR